MKKLFLVLMLLSSNLFAEPLQDSTEFLTPIRPSSVIKVTGPWLGPVWFKDGSVCSDNDITCDKKYHLATDIVATSGANYGRLIYSVANGEVIYSGNPSKSWGDVVIVLHRLPNGKYMSSMYAHLSKRYVSLYQQITHDTAIGAMGDANGRYSTHLHFEIRLGKNPDPGHGYVSDLVGQNGSEIDRYTDPLLFIELFGRSQSEQKPSMPIGLAPDGDGHQLQLCPNDNGEYLPCVRWFHSARGVFYDVYIDGKREGTTYDNRLFYERGLTEGERHFWFVVARNYFAARESQLASFTLWDGDVGGCGSDCEAPIPETKSATDITETSALLRGSVNPSGEDTDWWFEYWKDSNVHETSHEYAGNGYSYENVSARVENLLCGTTYSYKLVVLSDYGYPDGATRSFTTDECKQSRAKTPPVLDVQTSHLECGLIAMSWTAEEGTNYTVYKNGNYFHETGYMSSDGKITLSDQNQLVPGEFYIYDFEAQNAKGRDSQEVHVLYPPYICGDDYALPTEFQLFNSRQNQRCDGKNPAFVLQMTDMQNTTGKYSLYSNEQLLDAHNTTTSGLFIPLAENLAVGDSYLYEIEGQDENGNSIRPENSSVMIRVLSERCELSGLPSDPPGEFVVWHEPVVCKDGSPSIALRWSHSEGATKYSVGRFGEKGNNATYTNIENQYFVDSEGHVPGGFIVYKVVAENDNGLTESYPIRIFVPSDTCSTDGLPGDFLLFTEAPSCVDGKPALHLHWFPPSGDISNSHGWKLTSGTAGGSVNKEPSAINKHDHEITAGLRVGESNGVFVQVKDANDSTKTRESNIVYFTIPDDVCGEVSGLPDVFTQNIRGPFSGRAYLSGGVNPNGEQTTAHIEWGTSLSFGNTSQEFDIGDGVTYLYPGVVVDNLSEGPCSKYYYRAVATNMHGTVYGDTKTFMPTDCTGDPNISYLVQGNPGEVGKDIWTTSVYSYKPGSHYPGGGLDDHRILIGGWGDIYYGLLQFDISNLRSDVSAAYIELYVVSSHSGEYTGVYVDQVLEDWDWRISGTGSDNERLWWADRPSGTQIDGPLTKPNTGQWYRIDITELYRQWKSGEVPNYGVQLRPEAHYNDWVEFASSQADEALRPRLVVEL